MFNPRPKQQEVIDYSGGKMGVSAVPGSGKTQTLSYLAAKLIKEKIQDAQEVLIVTLVNSAVENFAGRVSRFVQAYGLLPNLNYRVRTLHGLAHDIVRERPGLVGLSDDFQIIDEREAEEILRDAALAWSRNNPIFEYFLDPSLEPTKIDWVSREDWPKLVTYIASDFIKKAKDLQLTPSDIRIRSSADFPLLEMGLSIYEDYNRGLAYRGAVDFNDLIRLALKALKLDRDYLERLQNKWVFILEDEAQDSSCLQEEILRLLCGPCGNWVRVGDPNQAIYETFTTANPKYLRNFLGEKDVIARELPNSGRSSGRIIKLANHLISWTRNNHPVEEVREALFPPLILPSPSGDPQPNPPDETSRVKFISKNFRSYEEIKFVAESLARWLPEHREETVAVLVPRNDVGSDLAKELKKLKIDYVELLKSTRSTREAAEALTTIIRYLAEPTSPLHLSKVYRVWRRGDKETDEESPSREQVMRLLKQCNYVEDFLWPRLDRDWLKETDISEKAPSVYEQLIEFRTIVRRWQGTTLLPIDQLLLTIAQDIFQEPSDLAIAHKLAVVMGQLKEAHPDRHLPELAHELDIIARNERKFLGFSEEDTGFEPEHHRGKVVIATMHRAKGLEWDRVYLMSLNNYDFPSGLPHDRFISEKWFIRDGLNLQAEVLAQLETIFSDEKLRYEEGQATQKARLSYAAERVRLFYVGITRARKDIIVTWNTNKRGELQPSVPFTALQTHLEEKYDK